MTLHLIFTLLLGCRALNPVTRDLDAAHAALAAGELDRAEQLAEAALEASPPRRKIERERAEALWVLGEIAARRGDLPLSVKLLLEAVDYHPELESAQALLGDGQRALGLADDAIRSYEHAAQLDTRDPDHQIALCEVYLELYQQDAARPRCARALELAPAHPRALAAAALVLARDGDADAAERALAAIAGLDAEARAARSREIAVARVEGPGRTLLTRIDQEPPGAPPPAAATLTRRGPAPGAEAAPGALEGAEELRFPAEPGALRAWLLRPATPGPWPAVVYLHAGFAARQEDLEAARPFAEAGYAVLLPTLRGEPGNPGEHELLYGEARDVEAALAWLRALPEIDAARIFVFGDREGGALAGLVRGARRTGSHAGLLPEQELVRYDLPFDLGDRAARRARGWVHRLASLDAPHDAYVSARDPLAGYAEELRSDATTLGAPLTVTVIPGEQTLARDEAIRAFLAEIQRAR